MVTICPPYSGSKQIEAARIPSLTSLRIPESAKDIHQTTHVLDPQHEIVSAHESGVNKSLHVSGECPPSTHVQSLPTLHAAL